MVDGPTKPQHTHSLVEWTPPRQFPAHRAYDGRCGITCVQMVGDYLGVQVASRDISWLVGRNLGSDGGIGKGLAGLGLVSSYRTDREIADLRAALDDGNLLILAARTKITSLDRWVVVHSHDGNAFQVACPLSGTQSWPADTLATVWANAGKRCFTVPAHPRHHPQAGSISVAADMAERNNGGWRPVHAKTLEEFVGPWPVILRENFAGYHWGAIRSAEKNLEEIAAFAAARPPERPLLIPLDHAHQDFAFFSFRRSGGSDALLAYDKKTGRLAGGIWSGLRWVNPAQQGRGLGAEMVLAAYAKPGQTFLFPNSYSEAGFGSRLAAHRIAVERALAGGLNVPEAVLTDYDRNEDGGVTLKDAVHSRLLAKAVEKGKRTQWLAPDPASSSPPPRGAAPKRMAPRGKPRPVSRQEVDAPRDLFEPAGNKKADALQGAAKPDDDATVPPDQLSFGF